MVSKGLDAGMRKRPPCSDGNLLPSGAVGEAPASARPRRRRVALSARRPSDDSSTRERAVLDPSVDPIDARPMIPRRVEDEGKARLTRARRFLDATRMRAVPQTRPSRFPVCRAKRCPPDSVEHPRMTQVCRGALVRGRKGARDAREW